MNEEKDMQEELNEDLAEGTSEAKEGSEQQEQTLEEKYAELNDKFIRLYSEFDNYRKRTNKEKVELISTASSSVLKDLLPTMDDFERAILNNETSEDLAGVKEGFHLIYNKLKSTLEAKGLKVMDSKGQDFNSDLHEAIANIPAPSDDLKGKIVDDVEKGYYLHDKVIRYAKVVVGQ